MAKITLDSIKSQLAEEHWYVVSEEYTNLKTEMEFQCPEGHSVFTCWEKLRQKRSCPVCNLNQLKNPKPVVIPKTSAKRVLGLDQASRVTGWSIFDGHKLVQYGIHVCHDGEEADRIHEVNSWLISMIQNWKPDYIGIEGIQYQQQFGVTTFQTLARLQGVLIETCKYYNVPYIICPVASWRNYCGVMGKTRSDRKKSMQLLVKKWFDVSVTDDCADAIGIGKYTSNHYLKQVEIIEWE